MHLKAWLRRKKWYLQHRFHLFGYEWKGKKYLAISRMGWRGEKWNRVFVIEQEVNHSSHLDDFHFKQIINPKNRI